MRCDTPLIIIIDNILILTGILIVNTILGRSPPGGEAPSVVDLVMSVYSP